MIDRTQSEWKSGWLMLSAAMIGYLCVAAPVGVIGPLVKPLGVAFGWSRASVTSAGLIAATGTLLFAPTVGYVADRVGPRRVALIGLLVLAAGLASIGMTGPSVVSWYAGWAVYAVAQAICGTVVWMNGVVSRFDRNRGLALAIMLSGQALSNGIMPDFVVYVLHLANWRDIFFILAGFALLVGLPLTWGFFYGASDLDRRLGKTGTVKTETRPSRPKAQTNTLFHALGSLQFWMIAIAFVFVAAASAVLMIHWMPILTDAGMSAREAATVAIILGPTAIFGRFVSGYALDRVSPRLVGALALSLPSVSYAILLLGHPSFAGASMCAVFLGLAMGTESQIMGFLVSRYFGQESFGAIYGVLLGLFSISFGLAPVAAGMVFDATRSYALSFDFLVAAPLASALLIAGLGRPRERALSPEPV